MRIGKRELTMAITAAAMTLALAGCMAGNNDSAGTTQSHGGRCLHLPPLVPGSDAGGSDNGAGAGGAVVR